MWLQNGRAAKGMSLDDVARVTKIQSRILERLEAGKLEGLPAEVFVRGFVRSVARCVGLDEDEALRRYIAATQVTQSKEPPAAARAMVEAMGDLVPTTRARNDAPVEPILAEASVPAIPVPETEPFEPVELEAVHGEIPSAEAREETLDRESPVVVAEEISTVAVEAAEQTKGDVNVEEISKSETNETPIANAIAAETPAAEIDTKPETVVDEPVVIAPPPSINLTSLAVPAEPAEPPKKKRTRRTTGTTSRRKRKDIATGTPAEPLPVVAAPAEPAPKKPRRRKAKGTAQVDTTTTTNGEELARMSAAGTDEAAPAPKRTRRRKARGTAPVETPVIEAKTETPATETVIETPVIEAATETPVIEAATETPVIEAATETPVIEAVIDAATETPATETPAIDAAPTTEATRASEAAPVETSSDVDGEAAANQAFIDASLNLDNLDNHEDSVTTRFERADDGELAVAGTWTPRMPPAPMPSPVSWRRPTSAAPALVAVIDDDDPEAAERALEERRVRESRRTFLPPILLERDGDRSSRQGGLTLAVIILLIAATLALSYLMRRPSSRGDGVTQLDTPTLVDTTVTASLA